MASALIVCCNGAFSIRRLTILYFCAGFNYCRSVKFRNVLLRAPTKTVLIRIFLTIEYINFIEK